VRRADGRTPSCNRLAPMASPRVRRQLPRRVQQIRILTWFQFHLSVLILVVAIAAGAILSGSGRSFAPTDAPGSGWTASSC